MLTAFPKFTCKLKKLFVLAGLLTASATIFAQLNVLVGYGLGYQSSNTLNDMIDVHNADNNWYKNELAHLDLLHGLHVGIRQDWGGIKTVMSYRNIGRSLRADGLAPGSDEPFERELFFRNNMLDVGLETGFSGFNIGASLFYNMMRIKGKTSDFTSTYTVEKEAIIGTHLYLNIQFYGKGMMGMALQPYVDIPLQSVDLDHLSDELGVNGTGDYQPMTFGITLLLVNGPQANR